MSDTAQKTYMQALYALACESGRQKLIFNELMSVKQIFKDNPEYLRLLSAPTLENSKKRELIDSAFGGRADEYIVNFLKVLCDNGRIAAFHGIADAYEEQYDIDNNILKINAVTAFPLSGQLSEKLRLKLNKVSGKTVVLTNTVQPDLLGGIMLKAGGKMLDATVRTRLDRLQEQLKNTGKG